MPEYKMHSEYISRYPYAREATMFYPSVDLKITNDTPHGVVIWPRYTDTSITVQLWSTPFARGEETGKSKRSGCGSVTTTRMQRPESSVRRRSSTSHSILRSSSAKSVKSWRGGFRQRHESCWRTRKE